MGLFRKKRDPISERARTLNQQISSLEAQIARLTAQIQTEPAVPQTIPELHSLPPRATAPLAPPSAAAIVPAPTAPAAPPTGPQPRLRSTALPHGPTIKPPSAPAPAPLPAANESPEPIFEDLPANPFRGPGEASPSPETAADLGVRQSDWVNFWQRLKNHFRGPPTSNPKLVNYLAAGSIQGLRPLRYEKRVARNRFIVLAVVLVLVLWGLVVIFLKR